MPFDALVLAAVRREIEDLLPARVDRVYLAAQRHGEPRDLVLVLFRPGARVALLLSVHPRFFRVHLSRREHPAAPPTPFLLVLRKHLEGAHLTAAEQVDRDRVLVLHFRTPLGTRPRLVAEIMGPGSNLVLTDGEGRILKAWRQEAPRPGCPRRVLLPGLPYEPPPPPSPGSWGPFAGREIAARADQAGAAAATAEAAAATVAAELWQEASTRPRPVVVAGPDGRGSDYWCLPPVAHGPVLREYTSMSELLDEFYGEAAAAEELEAWRQQLARALGRQRERQRRLVESLREDLARAEDSLRYRTWGELLLAQAAGVPAGRDRIRVTDYYREDQAEVEIPLDPALSVRQNAQEYLRRYAKARRALPPLRARLDAEEARLAYLEQLEEAVAGAADRDALEVLEREMRAAGIPAAPARRGREAGRGGRAERPPSRSPAHRILRFRLEGGEEVLVGTGAEANDFVTFVLGRPDDVWLHVRGVPGSHVLLRPAPGRPVAPEALERAASLAAYFSRLRRSSRVEVDWTLRKHVRRRPGAGPGQVLYREEHTLLVEPAPPPAAGD